MTDYAGLIQCTLIFVLRSNPHPQVLLGYKKRGFGSGCISGYGGKLQPRETPPECAARELAEESGISLTPAHLIPAGELVFLFPSRMEWSERVHIFRADLPPGCQAVETDEMRPEWQACAAVRYEQMWDDNRYWLPYVLAGGSVHGQFIFAADNQTLTNWTLQTQ
jgi:8-oxo-dGTP pyrophosphatase MutT (NUDIX family)